ncbi:MAG: hypothetical protein M3Y74_03000 [Chloroflexota bacterium]|nr:hypothetical protein [Chloroflexota bacterium]
MSARSIVHRTMTRLAHVTIAASRRPWAVLWIPLPIAWQIAARSADANRAEEVLALLLTIPELVGSLCMVALIGWQLWAVGKAVARRRVKKPQPPWVYPWFARIGVWFCVGLFLATTFVP